MTSTFQDGKEEGALRTIGEVSDALGIKPHVLRYWEQHFPMLKPLKRSGGRRYYRPSDVSLLDTINRLVNGEGYTLKGAKTAIREGRADKTDPASEERGVFFTHGSKSSDAEADLLPKLKSIRNQLAATLKG
ncbi:MerR family transcriptional regulator [Altererythrobacter lutimaris]|uniref:MerR family transcriptional regulator n=1 Tax=Altererythrobacter lutimaris TaxID=2743979 RepID=A0A850H8Q7_9SPHN|nr:MerR family transcriptional regulator [Altererythrobacter lutimaris]NVE94253.1 MerR family transcriptional regulator [Altererythrobacter lutimaris]